MILNLLLFLAVTLPMHVDTTDVDTVGWTKYGDIITDPMDSSWIVSPFRFGDYKRRVLTPQPILRYTTDTTYSLTLEQLGFLSDSTNTWWVSYLEDGVVHSSPNIESLNARIDSLASEVRKILDNRCKLVRFYFATDTVPDPIPADTVRATGVRTIPNSLVIGESGDWIFIYPPVAYAHDTAEYKVETVGTMPTDTVRRWLRELKDLIKSPAHDTLPDQSGLCEDSVYISYRWESFKGGDRPPTGTVRRWLRELKDLIKSPAHDSVLDEKR